MLEPDLDLGCHRWRDHQPRIEPIAHLKVGAGQHGRIQGQDPANVDFIGPASGPGMTPDVVNRAFHGNDVEAVLGERDFKARVHRTELVDITDMPAAAAIKENSLVVYEALEP